jgi:hypothetical protein
MTDSLTPLLLLTLMGQAQAKVGRILSTLYWPTYRPGKLIGRLIVISRHLSDDKFSDRKKLIEGHYRTPIYDKDD